MKVNKAFCLFEQSGTFKKEFQKLGIAAEDYDILNDFNETDHVVDLFAEIEKGYNGEPSIFDEVGENDIIFAFFPCTRFSVMAHFNYRGDSHQLQTWTDVQKLEYVMELHEELCRYYTLLCKMFLISMRGGYRMIVENPYTQPHYLTNYFPIKPSLIDNDRTNRGDWYKKPTQYWFVNCKPQNNLVMEVHDYVDGKRIFDINNKAMRSMIHPQYARRFIKEFILDEEKYDVSM